MMRSCVVLMLCLAVVASAADNVDQGTLVWLDDHAITVRRADGTSIRAQIPKNGPLSAATLVTQYKVADQVEIAYRPRELRGGEPPWELRGIQFLRRGTQDELIHAAAFQNYHTPGKSLLKTPAELDPKPHLTTDAALEHARVINRERWKNMPSFVADETARRYSRTPRQADWQPAGVLQSEVTYRKDDFTRQNIRLNGKPWKKPAVELPGIYWEARFGSEVDDLFDPECPIDFEPEPRDDGQQLLTYRFRAPRDGCFDLLDINRILYDPARTGRFVIDVPDGKLLHFEQDASEFPASVALASLKIVSSWDYVKIGDATHLLPVAMEVTALGSGGGGLRVVVEYRNHRHFESTSTITFH